MSPATPAGSSPRKRRKRLSSKILFLDIETRPYLAYGWRLFKENIGIEQIKEEGAMICFSAKYLGEKEVYFYSDWGDGHEEMLRQAHRLLSECDAVCTYNGDRFDLPKLRGEFLKHKRAPTPPLTSIDVFKTVRRMGYDSSKLAFVGPLLGVGSKVKHQGFSLWKDVLAGDVKAQRVMEKYCRQDSVLLEKLYKRLAPYITNHPTLGKTSGLSCPVCHSENLQSRGYRRTKLFKVQRIQCQQCGSWSDGKRTKHD